MARRIVFPRPRRVALESFDPPPIERGEVAVRARYTLMSTGTENIILNRRYEPGTHWDAWVRYPMYPGYAGVGEVVEAGPNAGDLAPGTMVAARLTHASDHVGGCPTGTRQCGYESRGWPSALPAFMIMVTRAPPSGRFCAHARPPCARAMVLTTASPSPADPGRSSGSSVGRANGSKAWPRNALSNP